MAHARLHRLIGRMARSILTDINKGRAHLANPGGNSFDDRHDRG
jgi:hypothetical protein